MMIDPGAMGTLLIGLRATREGLEAKQRAGVPARASSSTRQSVRAAFGRTLRLRAKRVEQVEPVGPPSMAVGVGD